MQPDPRFAFESLAHQHAVAKISYAADRKKGLAILMGPVGAGKTTIAQHLLSVWDQDSKKTIGHLPTASERTPAAFLRRVAEAFNLKPSVKIEDNKRTIERHLLAEHDAGRHCILLIDEGQDVHSDNIDVIADLTNFQTATSKLITVILLAQDNFPNKLVRKDKFRSRITFQGYLDPLSFADTRSMIAFRLETAGATAPISDFFTDQALEAIYDTTKGVPRDICVLCEVAFLNGFINDQRPINEHQIEAVVAEMIRTKQWPVELAAAPKRQRKTEKGAEA